MTKYVLTGATGGLGSQVLLFLLHLVPPSDIIVSTQNPAGAAASPALAASGVDVRHGDYADPASLARAFAGGTKLLLVSYPSIAYELRVRMHKNAIDAAKAAGIQHIHYTSLAFGGDPAQAQDQRVTGCSVAEVMQAHLDTEKYLKESGVEWTILREGIYSESWPLYLGFYDPKEEGVQEIGVPISDGEIAWVSRPDLGEGTARIIAAASGYTNRTLLLSGTRTLSLSALTAHIASLLHRPLRLTIVPVESYVAANTNDSPRGEPDFLRKWSTTYDALQRGECAVVDQTLKEVLGREPKPVEETVAAMLGKSVQTSESVMQQYAK